MIDLVLPGGEPFALYEAPRASTDKQELSAARVLPPEVLEHGAYYVGRFEYAPAIARWHAKKRRFLFGEHTLGRRLIRAVLHVADESTPEAFALLSKTQVKEAYRISDYAFETA